MVNESEIVPHGSAPAVFTAARELLLEFKGETYIHGLDVLPRVGPATRRLGPGDGGARGLLVRDRFGGAEPYLDQIRASLAAAGVTLVGELDGARANAPRDDLERITHGLAAAQPDVVISFGGGSTIDATKAAEVLCTLGGSVEDYFGTGLVSRRLAETGKALRGHVAIQTAASSGAHLTKYSNITDLSTGQKKLIVDEAIVPAQPVFDYAVTFGAPRALTADGALDGFSHVLEVVYGAVGKPDYDLVARVAQTAITLIVNYLPVVLAETPDGQPPAEAREALGLATDLGGYAIMIGGTNGAHLTSFSLVDILSHEDQRRHHEPYYTACCSPRPSSRRSCWSRASSNCRVCTGGHDQLAGRALGSRWRCAMMTFQESIGFPVSRTMCPGSPMATSARAGAARTRSSRAELENSARRASPPTWWTVLAGPVLRAAQTSELSLISNLE